MWRTDDPTPGNPLWVDLNASLAISQFYPGTQPSISDEDWGFGGTQDNDIQVFEGTLDWTQALACGDGGYTAVDSTTPTTIYAGCNFDAGAKVKKSVFYGMSTPGPVPPVSPSFKSAETSITASGDRMQFIPPLVMDPSQSSTLYFGTCRIWETTDSATTWNPVTGDLSTTNTPGTCLNNGGGSITTIDVSAKSSSILFAGTSNGKVWATNPTFGLLFPLTEIDNGLLPNRYVTAVRSKRNDSTGNIVYATFSGYGKCAGCDTKGHVFKSTNAASGVATWTDISGNLPDVPVNDIYVEHIGSPALDALYIATDVGVFSCPDAESATPCTNWTVIGDPLPNVPVVSLSMRRQGRILRAGTHGRSMWDIQLTDSPPSALPTLSSLTPAAVMAGSATTTVSVTGVNFSPNTQVLFSVFPTGVTTTYVSTTQLTVTFDTSLLTTGGVFNVTLTDPLGASATALPFTVMNPIPDITSIGANANPGVVGEPVTFTLTGTGFVTEHRADLQWNYSLRRNGFERRDHAKVTVPGTDLMAPSAGVTVTVVNPLPGGGTCSSVPQLPTSRSSRIRLRRSHLVRRSRIPGHGCRNDERYSGERPVNQ